MSKMSLKKWRSISNEERQEYIRKGVLKVEPVIGIVSTSKVGSDDKKDMAVRHRATVRGILIEFAETREAAFKGGYQWMADYTGELPEDRVKREADEAAAAADGVMLLTADVEVDAVAN